MWLMVGLNSIFCILDKMPASIIQTIENIDINVYIYLILLV